MALPAEEREARIAAAIDLVLADKERFDDAKEKAMAEVAWQIAQLREVLTEPRRPRPGCLAVIKIRSLGKWIAWKRYRIALLWHAIRQPVPWGDPSLGRTREERNRNLRLMAGRWFAKGPKPPRD